MIIFIVMTVIIFFCVVILDAVGTAIADSGKTPEEKKNKFWYSTLTNINKREVRIRGAFYDIDEIKYAKLEPSLFNISLVIHKEEGGEDRFLFSSKDEAILAVLEKKINDTKDYYSEN